jgi:hypothetical protein
MRSEMTQREKAFFILGMTAVLANFEEPMPNLDRGSQESTSEEAQLIAKIMRDWSVTGEEVDAAAKEYLAEAKDLKLYE